MRELLLCHNPDTGRCHGITSEPLMQLGSMIHIYRVPNGVPLPQVCMLVEKRADIRMRGHGTYEELQRRPARKLRKAS